MGLLGDGKIPPSKRPVDRIIQLPVVGYPDEEELEQISRECLLGRAFDKGFRLHKEQAAGIQAFDRYGGLFGPIGVGRGKTLLTLMCAEHHLRANRDDRVLLIVPSTMIYQLTRRDIGWARTKIPFGVPIFNMGGRPPKYRKTVSESGRPGLYILPFSLLSREDTEHNLAAIDASVVIIDEAHNVARQDSARTGRLKYFLDRKEPKVVALSGTITSKSVMDYHHIIRVALKDNCPLPKPVMQAQEWAAILDSGADSAPSSSVVMPIRPLVTWATEQFPEEEIPWGLAGIRHSYKLRLRSCPGVVASGDKQIGTSLTLVNEQARTAGEELKKLADQVVEEMLTPNGDEIDHAIHTFKWLSELTAGFYNELVWPEAEVLAKRRHISVGEARRLLDQARANHEDLQDLHRAVRRFLGDYRIQGMDTPMLLGKEMSLNGDKHVPGWLYKAWTAERNSRVPGMPQRDSRAVRIDDYKIAHAVEWAQARENGGILWVYHQEVGRWLYERLPDAVYCPAGAQANRDILRPDNAGKIIIASLSAHGEGKDGLQRLFTDQLMVEWPRSARRAEQLLGRLHREGQEADHLLVTTNRTNFFDQQMFAACLNDALYLHQTTLPQRLIYAEYRPIPKIVPTEVLRQMGFENKMLSAGDQELLREMFPDVD